MFNKQAKLPYVIQNLRVKIIMKKVEIKIMTKASFSSVEKFLCYSYTVDTVLLCRNWSSDTEGGVCDFPRYIDNDNACHLIIGSLVYISFSSLT